MNLARSCLRAQAIGYVINAASNFGRGDNINQRARGVGHCDFRRSAPQRFPAEEAVGGNVMQHEDGALRGRAWVKPSFKGSL